MRLNESGEKAYAIAYLTVPLEFIFRCWILRKLKKSGGCIWKIATSKARCLIIDGVVSLGTDIFFIQNQIREITFQIVLSTIIILMLVWLGIAEAVAWFEGRQIFEKALIFTIFI